MFPVPNNEHLRLRRVVELGIMDSAPEPQFDALVQHATELFGVPISLITILDGQRQWFKAVHGMNVRETDREVAFCNHAIAPGTRLIVEDARQDPRFASNPLVTGPENVRFYAGVPLAIGAGLHAGTLCILDTKPRRFSDNAIQALSRLGDIAESLIKQFAQANELARLTEEIGAKNLLLTHRNAELQVQQQLLAKACGLANMGAWERDLTTGDYRWSDTLYEMHGIEHGTPITETTLRAFYSDSEWARLAKVVDRAYRDHSPYEIDLEYRTSQGQTRHARITSAVEFGQDGLPIRRFGLKQDITADKETREELRRLAETDRLTGIANRATLLSRIADHQGAEDAVCLMMIDLDGFKDINDTSGHDAGDACLLEVARRMGVLPIRACVARVGGDEFAILFSPSGEADMDQLADWVLRELARPFIWAGQGFQLSASIGITYASMLAAGDPARLLSEADLALYAAKAKGKNRFEFFSEALREEAARKVSTINKGRDGLNRREFLLFYQPKFRLADKTILGFEALLRWRQGDRVVGPGEFRAALDDTILSREIGDFVIEEAFRQAGEWARAGIDFGHVAVNMSPQQFHEDGLVESFLARLDRHGLAPTQIQVEITEETVLSRSADEVRASCGRLREAGVRIAFDDFGTGFASMTHLIEFPVDIIKIDRSFVSRLFADARARAVVTSIVTLAKNLDLDVVAEGVETDTEAQLLQAMGCCVAQGYLLSPAVPADRLFQPERGHRFKRGPAQ